MLTVVTGPPCSGKTTYVQESRQSHDIVVDFDALAVALGSPVTHGHARPVWKTAIEARDAAVEAAIAQHHKGATVWVIDTRPLPSKRRWYTAQGARFVDLTAPVAELHRRADADGRPQSWHDQIDALTGGTVETRSVW
jgi:hypothetical protein